MGEDKKAVLNQDSFEGNELAKAVFELAKNYTCFPGTLVNTQCRKIGTTPLSITQAELPALAEAMEKALTNFANPLKIQTAKNEILKLAKNGKG